jgi:hypothetical protein
VTERLIQPSASGAVAAVVTTRAEKRSAKSVKRRKSPGRKATSWPSSRRKRSTGAKKGATSLTPGRAKSRYGSLRKQMKILRSFQSSRSPSAWRKAQG